MSQYRRARVAGGTYFFTVVTAGRRPWLATDWGLQALRATYRQIAHNQPFKTLAMVVLPDHLHCVWRLPAGDDDFPRRWQRIKRCTTERLQAEGHAGPFWQARFWEHLIRDEHDLQRHLDYIHYNPVRHGHVHRASDWTASSIHRYIRAGWYASDWGVDDPQALEDIVLARGGDV